MTIPLGVLRAGTSEALPFARQKLHSCLVQAGLGAVAAGKIASVISQSLRERIPAELEVVLDEDAARILLLPAGISGRHQTIHLPAPPTDIETLKDILGQPTREELLSNLTLEVEARTADLKRERELSERLLKNMLPEAIAVRLKNGKAIADNHEATVVFADIVGFTALASKQRAEDLVALLDRIFRVFDQIVQKYGLEKIKTIGDAYMAAAGLPEPQVDHVDRAVLAGLDFVAALPRIREEIGIPIDVRVGIHTGPVVAGVIGTQKYAYDIWGDTVNVASRMESHGVAGRVHVSDDVRAALGKRFRIERRGNVELKNRGTMETWFIEGVAAI